MVIDAQSGRLIAKYGRIDSVSSPGSTLKPFVLRIALSSHLVDVRTRIACSGTMRLGQHDLACTHPRTVTVLDARQALANSCNTYFATVAQRMRTADLVDGLRRYGMVPMRVPESPDERILLALGLAGVAVSPRQLAEAYRRLATDLEDGNDDAAAAVREGLLESVTSGMAHAAQTEGVVLAGKTGSAHDRTLAGQHGWFAGVVFADGKRRRAAAQVLVVAVPGGNGNDAAMLARRVLQAPR